MSYESFFLIVIPKRTFRLNISWFLFLAVILFYVFNCNFISKVAHGRVSYMNKRYSRPNLQIYKFTVFAYGLMPQNCCVLQCKKERNAEQVYTLHRNHVSFGRAPFCIIYKYCEKLL